MHKVITINKQAVNFSLKDDEIFCTSLDVAKVFGKRHDDVLKAIRNILNDLREIGTSQDLRNFAESFQYRKIEGFRGRERKYPYYNLTRDGFSLLAMSFTGKKALEFKLAFLRAFNELEKIAKNIEATLSSEQINHLGLTDSCKAKDIILKFATEHSKKYKENIIGINSYDFKESLIDGVIKRRVKINYKISTPLTTALSRGKNNAN